MAHTRRSPHQRAPSSSLSSPSILRKKYSLRRAATRTSSHAPTVLSPTSQDHRPVLVPLHQNLRRLPSRLFAHKDSDKDMVMRDPDQVIQVGVKRKRVASTNENALANGRLTRGTLKRKRLRTTSMIRRDMEYFSDDTDTDMETASGPSSSTTESKEESEEEESGTEEERGEDEGEDESSTDDHLLHFASSKSLTRLRKPDLVRLYSLAGLPDDAELLTKHEIIDCLIAAREEYASLPPSSPVGRNDASSSGSLSDDGNVAGGEETDATPLGHVGSNGSMRRRVTSHDLGKLDGRVPKGRSMSMGNLANHDAMNLGHGHSERHSAGTRGESSGSSTSKRRTSNRSSPTSSTANQPPPTTRLRTRKVSATSSVPGTTPTSANSKSCKGKGKSKQVEFSRDVDVQLKSPPSKRRLRERAREREHEARAKLLEEESDLTDVEEVGQSIKVARVGTTSLPQISPRRLRSKDKEAGRVKTVSANAVKERRNRKPLDDAGDRRKRVAPMRKTSRKIQGSKEEDNIDEQEEEGEVDEDELLDEAEGEEEGEEAQTEEEGEELTDEDVQEEEEIDELVSSASATPPMSQSRRTPLRKRLRPRTRKGSAAPDDGDIEDEGEEDEEGSKEDEEAGESGEEMGSGEEIENGEEDAEGEEDVEGSEDEATIAVEPRKLRSGKVVGEEEDVEMETVEEDIGEEDSETGEEEEVEELEVASEIDVDAEGETDEDEIMEEEVDLTIATAKTLVRLRRDDLIRLCETRDLEPVGTKPQLAEALLQWRDRQAHSSPSSTGTVRPPSTSTRKRGRKRATSSSTTAITTPVLLRPEHFHDDEPRTPVPDQEKEAEQELELDLESLGLEDREIPPEKLTKLEKIGSGGFKDVFIGKFKGRRVAISEFRGTLSTMDIKELKLLGGFDHPNIVRFLGVSIPENTKETPVMIVSELCSNGDLYDYIRNTNTPSLHKVLSMMLDIARGLEYLHTRKPSVIHRDCKSSNILITARGTAKIADFGLAKVKQSTRSMVKSLVGTVNWQAPELWTAHPKYNHKVDVFSCALVFWEMLQWHLPARKHPWEGMNEHAIYDIVGAKRQRLSVSGLRKQWCPEIVDLMERMWAHEHQDRPTMLQVVQELEEMLARG